MTKNSAVDMTTTTRHEEKRPRSETERRSLTLCKSAMGSGGSACVTQSHHTHAR